MGKNLTEQTPSEIDAQIADINLRAQRPENRERSALNIIEQHADQELDTTPRWEQISEYALTQAKEQLDQAHADLDALRAEMYPLNAEFNRRGGWTRFFHVTNTNGHVHNSMHCSSCFPDTQYVWRTDLSGATEEQVVEWEAYQACSVCMPIAPAEQKAAFKVHQAEKRATKAAEKELKNAEKAARKLKREESLAHKVNAAIDKYGADEIQQAWFDAKIGETVYNVIFDMGKASERKYGSPS